MRNFETEETIIATCSSSRWSSTGAELEEVREKKHQRRSSICSIPRKPRQILKRNSRDLERETPARTTSQSVRRHADLEREMSSVDQSLQAMAAFVHMVESKPGSAEVLQSQLRRSLPPRPPQRQRSSRMSSRRASLY